MTTKLKAPKDCSGFSHEGVNVEIVDGYITLDSGAAVEVAKNFGFVEVSADPIVVVSTEPDGFTGMTASQLEKWLDENKIPYADAKNKADLLVVCRANAE